MEHKDIIEESLKVLKRQVKAKSTYLRWMINMKSNRTVVMMKLTDEITSLNDSILKLTLMVRNNENI